MRSKAYQAWVSAGWDAWWLAADASLVMGLRLTRLAAGGEAASREATLMVTEKIAASIELQSELMRDATTLTPLKATQKAVRHYSGKVAANRRRLSSPRRDRT